MARWTRALLDLYLQQRQKQIYDAANAQPAPFTVTFDTDTENGIIGYQNDLNGGTFGSDNGAAQPFGEGMELLEYLVFALDGNGSTSIVFNGDITGLSLVDNLVINGVSYDATLEAAATVGVGSTTINGNSFDTVTTIGFSDNPFGVTTDPFTIVFNG